ncbi:MAG: hypothetical protein ACYTEZ_15295 [Planctomycetota bacterium]
MSDITAISPEKIMRIRLRGNTPEGSTHATEASREFDDAESDPARWNAVLGDFTGLEIGSEVRFTEEPGEKGAQATSLRPVGRHHHLE